VHDRADRGTEGGDSSGQYRQVRGGWTAMRASPRRIMYVFPTSTDVGRYAPEPCRATARKPLYGRPAGDAPRRVTPRASARCPRPRRHHLDRWRCRLRREPDRVRQRRAGNGVERRNERMRAQQFERELAGHRRSDRTDVGVAAPLRQGLPDPSSRASYLEGTEVWKPSPSPSGSLRTRPTFTSRAS
jgi:hypothetical protein